jgi:hypothetical protein
MSQRVVESGIFIDASKGEWREQVGRCAYIGLRINREDSRAQA